MVFTGSAKDRQVTRVTCDQECSKQALYTKYLQNILIPDAVYLIGQFYHKQCSTHVSWEKEMRKLTER